tara:strand:- start:2000 stop:3238 length:1239 start_codon:yes stop_codon:yes gene_type:complete
MELLAPAGNLEKLKTAVLYGANAVYLAGKKFSLRGASDNFSDEELISGVQFAKSKGSRVYLTLNSFLHDKELSELSEYIKIIENIGVDAVIVSDVGVLTIVQKNSSLPIHISTQSSCLNVYAAKFWKNLGAKRLVLGREVSLDEAFKIKKEVDIEIELFIHGSMCMSYSGNCIISNYTAGRDSNRGGCIQSCRFSYSKSSTKLERKFDKKINKSESILSSKDLRGLELLPDFIKAGVDSIKIEGRMKSSLYVATTSSLYSRAINLCNQNISQEISKLYDFSKMLENMPHRGYTSGSLKHKPDENSIYIGDRNGINSRYEFAGTVMEVDSEKSFTILAQKSFDNNCLLEIINFDGTILQFSAKGMMSIQNHEVSRSNPNRLIKIPFASKNIDYLNSKNNLGIQPFNVVRIKNN